nr:helix-turn-helix transcriptional regulator [Ornithinimicrobium murale]
MCVTQTSPDPAALRRARLRAGLTQHELARRVGVAGGERISKWELGTAVPRAEYVHRLARELGTDVGALLGTTGVGELRWLRTSRGLSAREVAERAQVGRATYVAWEAGKLKRAPRDSTLALVASALELDVDDVRQAVELARQRRGDRPI